MLHDDKFSKCTKLFQLINYYVYRLHKDCFFFFFLLENL